MNEESPNDNPLPQIQVEPRGSLVQQMEKRRRSYNKSVYGFLIVVFAFLLTRGLPALIREMSKPWQPERPAWSVEQATPEEIEAINRAFGDHPKSDLDGPVP